MADELRPADADPDLVMMFGAVLLFFAGAAAAVTSGQFLALWYLETWQTVVVVLQGGLGLAAVLGARGLWDGRPWGSILGALVAPLLAVLGTVWAVYCMANLSFSLYLVLAPPLAGMASLVVPLLIPATLRCARARRQVEAQVRDAGMFAGGM
jgi:hypothetical protein